MRTMFFSSAAIAAVTVLIVGLINPLSTSATVPGINAGIDVNTSGGSPNGASFNAAISQDGRYVAFQSQATNLVSPASSGSYQVFVRDRLNNTTTEVSVSTGGIEANSLSQHPRISEDGRYVVFDSGASNLVSGDTNGAFDVFIHDMLTGTTELVSKNSSGVEGDGGSDNPDISADGNYVVFVSSASNLVSGQSSEYPGIFVKNMATGEVKLVSQSASGVWANRGSINPRISCEGRFVTFESSANNLVSGDPFSPSTFRARIYVVDMLKPIAPMYIKSDPNTTTGLGNSSITCNGDYIGFASDSSNIVSGDTNNKQDTFVYDRINNTFERVSVDSSGNESNGASFVPAVSNDGKYVVFDSSATNLVPGDTNTKADIFLHNRQSGTTEIVTRDSGGTLSNGFSATPDISSDGRYVAYSSFATNLVTGFSGSYATYESQTGASDDY